MFKTSRANFLAQNPFPQPLTFGFFYREKMRAIHHIAPDLAFRDILEVGGGRSGLTAMLYPDAQVTNLDMNAAYAEAPCHQKGHTRFVCGDARALPFAEQSFDAVTMFDLLEHVPEHKQAIAEALRVLRPGGWILVSTPMDTWRFPYYRCMQSVCPSEEDLFAEWGHVRRGYGVTDLAALIGLPCRRVATFINPITVLCHDIAFSRLSRRRRRYLCLALSPLTWTGYALHGLIRTGTETASAWQKPEAA